MNVSHEHHLHQQAIELSNWLASSAADDLVQPAEVSVTGGLGDALASHVRATSMSIHVPRPPSSTPLNASLLTSSPHVLLANRVGLSTENPARTYLSAAREFATGELIMAELAVYYVVGAKESDWTLDKESDWLIESAKSLRFSRPFASRWSAAVRVAAQVERRGMVDRARSQDTPSLAPSSRAALLASALRRAGLRCRSSKIVTRADATDNSVVVEEPYIDALFARCSLLTHSCTPNAAYRSTWDNVADAPAVHVYALRGIAAGERLTVAYCNLVQSRPERQVALISRYGFVCTCQRCNEVVDDAVAVRCGMCNAGVLRAGDSVCASCGSLAPTSDALYVTREQALQKWISAADLPALSLILHDADAGMLLRLIDAVKEFAYHSAAGNEEAQANALAVSSRVVAVASKVSFFPQPRLVEVLYEHALLCGATGDSAASSIAWATIARVGRPYLVHSAPYLLEAYEAFAAKPPRSKSEAGVASRMVRQLLLWQQ